jgi:hypothetical protein
MASVIQFLAHSTNEVFAESAKNRSHLRRCERFLVCTLPYSAKSPPKATHLARYNFILLQIAPKIGVFGDL